MKNGSYFVDDVSGIIVKKKSGFSMTCVSCGGLEYLSRLLLSRKTRQLCQKCGGHLEATKTALKRHGLFTSKRDAKKYEKERRCLYCPTLLRSSNISGVCSMQVCQSIQQAFRYGMVEPKEVESCERGRFGVYKLNVKMKGDRVFHIFYIDTVNVKWVDKNEFIKEGAAE